MFNEDELRTLIVKWQNVLRLKDWDIKLDLVTKDWRKTGDVKIDISNKVAILLINNFNPKRTNIESGIIHELLHIKLYGMDQMIDDLLHCVYGNDQDDPKFSFAYSQFMEMLESTTEDLTKGYTELGSDNKSLPFGRIQKEADDEWNKM
jgi:hypothetical protein